MTPPSGPASAARPSRPPGWGWLALLVCLALPVVATWRVLGDSDRVFAFNDGNIEMALSPTYAYPQALSALWDNGIFFGQPIGRAPLNLSSVLESVLGPAGYRRWGVPLFIALTGLAGIWMLRAMGRSPEASALGGLLLLLSGWVFTFPLNGLPVRSATLGFSALAAGMLHRARPTGSWLRVAVAGAFLGLGVAETPDVGIFFSIAVAGYLAVLPFPSDPARLVPRLGWVGGRLAVLTAAALLVAGQTIVVMLETQIRGVAAPTGEEAPEEDAYAWATQWSLPPAETWSLFAADYHGASSRSESHPYWGRMGRPEGWRPGEPGFRNFRLAGYALGGVALAALLLAATASVRKSPSPAIIPPDDTRTARVALGICAISLLLAWGRHFPAYRLFFALPFMGTIRNPDKWLGPFTLFAVALVSLATDGLLRLGQERDPATRRTLLRPAAWAVAGAAALAALGTARLALTRGPFLDRLTAEGYARPETIWANALSANLVLLLTLAAVTAIVTLWLRRPASVRRRWALVAALGLVMALELGNANRRFVESVPYRHLQEPGPVGAALDSFRGQGRMAVMPPADPLLNHLRLSHLMVTGYPLFNPVSVSRMPEDYDAFFRAVSPVPNRLWRLGSVHLFLTYAEAVPQLAALDPAPDAFAVRAAWGVVTDGDAMRVTEAIPREHRRLRLLEYRRALPMLRWAGEVEAVGDGPAGDRQGLARLSEPGLPVGDRTPLPGPLPPEVPAGPDGGGPIEIGAYASTRAEAVVETETGGLLVRAVKHHPDWRVTVNGDPAPLLRANYLFQAVAVPPGRHEVAFRFAPPVWPLVLAVAGRAALLAALAALVMGRGSSVRRSVPSNPPSSANPESSP